jgi:hypothetical protein
MAYISFQPKDYFNTKLYTGTGSSNSITGVGFQPDWVWIKRRSATSSHQLFDAVRGVTKRLFSDSNEAESTSATTLTSFDTDGFTVSTHTGLNNSSDTYLHIQETEVLMVRLSIQDLNQLSSCTNYLLQVVKIGLSMIIKELVTILSVIYYILI